MPKNLFQDMVKVKRERQEEARKATAPMPELGAPGRLVRHKPREAREEQAEETPKETERETAQRN